MATPLLNRLLPFALPVTIIALWQLSASTGYVAKNVLPAPSDVLAAFLQLSLNGELITHIGVSLGRALAGFFVGGAIGFALGLANGLWQRSETLTDTTIQMVRNIPNLALIPLVIVWFGIGEEAKLFLVSFGVFFPVYINTRLGIRTVDCQLIEMADVYGFSRAELFWRVLLPGALPNILVGVRYALGIMWLTLIVAETISASSGLGYLAMQAREFLQLQIVVLAILIYALLGKLADSLTRQIERRTLAWHPSFQ